MSSRLTLLALALAVSCRPSSAPEPASARTDAYVLRLGNDTLAVDQFTRTPDRIEGTLVTHLPRAVVTRYVVTLDPTTGRPLRAEYNSRLPDGSLIPGNQPSVRQVTIDFTGDSAMWRQQRDTAITARIAARNAFPYVNYGIAFFQIPIAALRASGADSGAYAIYTGGRVTTPMAVKRTGSNTYSVAIGGFPYAVTTDERGTVQTVDGARTTQHFVTRRQGSVDVAALAAAWGARDREARPAVALSLRDTTRATIGAAQLLVDYGRPMARGRRVWGSNGVLNDTIWRTGANAATQLRTSAPITVGGREVPAGTYTLWTLAVPGRYQLIINKQTGQWGTLYDAAQDLVRVPLTARALSPAMDRFTIAIEPTGSGSGVLRLQWDTTELSVPITAP
jgi:hypothetical protein